MSAGPITVTLPYPLSANRYWRSFVPRGQQRAIVTVSDEAKAYRKAVAMVLDAFGVHQPLQGRVAIHVQLYPHRPQDWQKRVRKDPLAWDDTVQCLDLDNANKVLLDTLKGVAIEDDKWVRRLSSERMEPDGEGRVVVTITAIVKAGHPQAELLETAGA